MADDSPTKIEDDSTIAIIKYTSWCVRLPCAPSTPCQLLARPARFLQRCGAAQRIVVLGLALYHRGLRGV